VACRHRQCSLDAAARSAAKLKISAKPNRGSYPEHGLRICCVQLSKELTPSHGRHKQNRHKVAKTTKSTTWARAPTRVRPTRVRTLSSALATDLLIKGRARIGNIMLLYVGPAAGRGPTFEAEINLNCADLGPGSSENSTRTDESSILANGRICLGLSRGILHAFPGLHKSRLRTEALWTVGDAFQCRR
jgi:hypothetical protein